MLSDDELTAMQDTQALAFPDSARVYRRVSTADGQGGYTQTWPTVTHTYACRLSYRGVPSAYVALAAARNQTPLMVTFADDADVLAGDRLSINLGAQIEVIGIASGGAWITALRVVCVAVV